MMSAAHIAGCTACEPQARQQLPAYTIVQQDFRQCLYNFCADKFLPPLSGNIVIAG